MSLQGLTAFILGLFGGLIFFQIHHAYPMEMQDDFWISRDIHKNMDPPGRFVHPFKGKLIERKIKGKRVQGSEGYSLLGTIEGKPVCYIYFTDDRARQHELAHCNGWPADHRREGLDRFHWSAPPPRQ